MAAAADDDDDAGIKIAEEECKRRLATSSNPVTSMIYKDCYDMIF
jgi:hypothetical protein